MLTTDRERDFPRLKINLKPILSLNNKMNTRTEHIFKVLKTCKILKQKQQTAL